MNADAIAPYYQALEYLRFGRTLERARRSLLPHLTACTKGLVLGDGDGRFLQPFVEQQPDTHIDAVDVSAKMLQLAQGRVRRRSRAASVRFHHADIRTAALPGSGYDLIATHFFLDVFSEHELELWVSRVAHASASNALWLVSEFDLPAAGWRRHYQAAWLAMMYKAFHITTGLANQRLPDWRPILRRNGFHAVEARRFRNGFIVSELWRRLPHLQTI